MYPIVYKINWLQTGEKMWDDMTIRKCKTKISLWAIITVAHTYNLSTQEIRDRGSEVQGHSLLHIMFKVTFKKRGRKRNKSILLSDIGFSKVQNLAQRVKAVSLPSSPALSTSYIAFQVFLLKLDIIPLDHYKQFFLVCLCLLLKGYPPICDLQILFQGNELKTWIHRSACWHHLKTTPPHIHILR